MSPGARLTGTGFALIAVAYGLARFAYGLFLPRLREDLGIGPALSGAIGGGSFLGYCAAIVASALLTGRFGPRPVAVAAGAVAALAVALAATPAA
ncbi:MAG: MFS transporter, partial [Geminicoccaceae bacterium]|nr:MFS transporter [Geminicoccaceae bacterium]